MQSPRIFSHLNQKIMRKKKTRELAIEHPHACGIDVGSKFHAVATGLGDEDIVKFGVYTEDHKKLISYLKEKKVLNIAMESTGSYWQSLFLALQKSGFVVQLVDGKQTKSYKNKTDFKDARAIYQLHSLGLLSACFLPDDLTERMRAFYRYRVQLLEESTRYVNRMQKALRLMNFRLDNVVSDVMGKSGHAIIQGILEGEEDGLKLAELANSRLKKSREEIAAGLMGHREPEQMYLLKDCFEAYHAIQKRIKGIDEEIRKLLETAADAMPKKKGTKTRVQKNQVNIGLEDLSCTYYGVDLFAVKSVSFNLVMTLISEVGWGITEFPNSRSFVAWLRLSPNNKISGGKILSSRTPKGKNALAIAFRNAANTVAQHKKGYLKAFFNRIAYKKGRAAAITATARKLATIVWNMIYYQKEYEPVSEKEVEEKIRQKVVKNIKHRMKRLGITLEEVAMHTELNNSRVESC